MHTQERKETHVGPRLKFVLLCLTVTQIRMY